MNRYFDFQPKSKILGLLYFDIKADFLSWSLVGKVVLQMSSDVASLNFISNTTFGSTTFELTTPASNDAPTLSKSVFGDCQRLVIASSHHSMLAFTAPHCTASFETIAESDMFCANAHLNLIRNV